MVTKPVKYTEAFVSTELESMLSELLSDESIMYIGQLFLQRSYSRQRFSEWTDKFKDNEQISDIIKKIEDTLETRLVLAGLDSLTNVPMTIFTLKNKHGWKDVKEQTNNNVLVVPILSQASLETMNGISTDNGYKEAPKDTKED